MKHFEELTRLHVEEAIQTGLRSQSAHRALSGHRRVSSQVSMEKRQSSRINIIFLLVQMIGKIVGG